MKVLVTASSKYGSTAEIAQAIGDVLTAHGFDVAVLPFDDVSAPDDYDALVLGSAVYAGHWLSPAKEFVQQHAQALSARPVWLFSSGPIGEPPKPAEDPVDVTSMVEASAARDHRLFAGKLDRSRPGFAKRAIAVALRAPYGDFRDWSEIRAWAASIADALQTSESQRRGETPQGA
jgi:menaquinone-dependent protoporphyrinogen oxidase